jgi:hypothetical protein
MSAAANAPDPPTQPSRSARLLGLVRTLIDYGKELAATIRERVVTDPISVRCGFGTVDVGLILARIARGLHRANALEARLLSNAHRLDAPPRRAASTSSPRLPRPAAAPANGETDEPIARLPTPDQIATAVRHQPIGAVIADICRDLGITPRHPLWRELQLVIIREGGSLARLVSDMLDQVFPMPAIIPARSPTLPRQIPAAACTGPP